MSYTPYSRNPAVFNALATSLPEAPLLRDDRDSVRFLQQILIELGKMVPGAIRFASGFYGQFTAAAVADVQRSLGLAPTGVYDAAVRAQLLKELTAAGGDGAASAPAQPIAPQPSDVYATLNYTNPDDPHGNLVPHKSLIRDARPIQNAGSLSLESHGFGLVDHQTVLSKDDFYKGRGLIESVYFKEMEQLIQQSLGADRVFALASQVRNSTKATELNPSELNPFEEKTPTMGKAAADWAPAQVSSYASKVHTDFTGSKSAEKFYRAAGIPEGVKVRYVLINAWRNISDTEPANRAVETAGTARHPQLGPRQPLAQGCHWRRAARHTLRSRGAVEDPELPLAGLPLAPRAPHSTGSGSAPRSWQPWW